MGRWNGKKLKRLREAAGLSRRGLMFAVRDLGETRTRSERTIQRWEDGETAPDADDLAAIAHVLDCDVRDFFGEAAVEEPAA